MPPADRADLANVFHGHRLAAAGVVGDGQHHQRHALAAHALDQLLQRRHVHVAFEWMRRGGLPAFGNDQVDRLGADKLDVGAGGVEVRVVGDHVALLAHHAEQDALGGAALVSGNHVPVAEDVLHRIAEPVEASAAGVTLVALHDRRPLVRGHGPGAGVGQQVDQHIVGRKQKQIVVRGAQQLLALLAGGPADRLDALDAERLDDGARHEGQTFTESPDSSIGHGGGAFEFVPGEGPPSIARFSVLNRTIEKTCR